MNGYIGVTDLDWYSHLAERADVDEVNFWRPGRQGFRRLTPGEPFIFKLRAPRNAVVGFGHFRRYDRLPLWYAWDVFGAANGAASELELRERLAKLGRDKGLLIDPEREIGCITIGNCVFLEEKDWITPPADWAANIVSGKGYDLSSGEGARIWQELLSRAGDLDLVTEEALEVTRYGAARLVRQRLGQREFSLEIRDAYGACAVTGEHSMPVLEAAHIQPYGQEGEHSVANGMLLRRDVHRLFDLGYVTVTPDYNFAVSEQLAERYANGKAYYELAGERISLPHDKAKAPSAAKLEWHGENVFQG